MTPNRPVAEPRGSDDTLGRPDAFCFQYGRRRVLSGLDPTIDSGITGDRLPTAREVAAIAGINSNTVLKAYRELEHEGVWCNRGRAPGHSSRATRGRRAAAKESSAGAALGALLCPGAGLLVAAGRDDAVRASLITVNGEL